MATFAETILTKIEAVLDGRVAADVQDYRLPDGRSLTKIPVLELVQLRDKFRAEVKAEQAAANIAAGLGNPNKIRVRF